MCSHELYIKCISIRAASSAVERAIPRACCREGARGESWLYRPSHIRQIQKPLLISKIDGVERCASAHFVDNFGAACAFHVYAVGLRKRRSSGCDGALLRCVVLEILMYKRVHSGSCAPHASYCIRLAHLFSASLNTSATPLLHQR